MTSDLVCVELAAMTGSSGLWMSSRIVRYHCLGLGNSALLMDSPHCVCSDPSTSDSATFDWWSMAIDELQD